MPGTARFASVFIVTVAIAGICHPVSVGAQGVGGVARLSWLAGCWSSEKNDAGSVEQWMQPAAGAMLGMARTVKSGKTVEFEFMRIHEAPDGTLLFTAIPSGQKEATFSQLRISDAEVAFENPAHDFPQRVIYRRVGDTRLVASIEGMRKGALRTIEFPMQRTKCES